MASVDVVEHQTAALREDTDAKFAALEKKYGAQVEELTSRVSLLEALSAGMRFMLNMPSDEFVVEAHKAYGPQEPSESWCIICLLAGEKVVPTVSVCEQANHGLPRTPPCRQGLCQ